MISQNLQMLSGYCELKEFDEKGFAHQCTEMKTAGYCGTYFCDLFFISRAKPSQCDVQSVLFEDHEAYIQSRPVTQLKTISKILDDVELDLRGVHFLQVMPPSGEAPQWIFPLHERLLDMAAMVGVERVTTHIGWEIHGGLQELREYDPKFYHDSLVVYEHLCQNAKSRGIKVTIETACRSWPWLDENPFRIRKFIEDLGTENLGVCLDSGHSHIAGLDIPKLIHDLSPLIWETHFHDNFGRSDPYSFSASDLHNPVGIGVINWLDIIRALQATTYKGIITFEQSDFRVNLVNWQEFLKTVP